MEILYILNTLVLGFFLWDIHRGVKEISAQTTAIVQIAEDIHQRTEDLHAKTDVLLQRLPPA